MLTRFFFVVLVLVGIGVFAIEYTREDNTTEVSALQPLAVTDEADILGSGIWATKGYDTSGTWRIVRSDETLFVELDESFSTRNAPDLKVFLSPTVLNDLTDGNATDGALLISALVDNKGAQRFEVPPGTDLAAYETIIIHCEQFSKLWSGASLK